MKKMNGFILVNQYGKKMCFTKTIEEAKFALKVFGEDWHIEESEEPKVSFTYSALDVMGYTC